MRRLQGPNERALVVMLHQRGVKLTQAGELAAAMTLARTLARQLDDPEGASAAAASVYLSTIRLLLEQTRPNDAADDDGPAETIRQLRSV